MIHESRSILTVLFTINIELINIAIVCICCPVLLVKSGGFTLSFLVAQVLVAFSQALLCLICELALALSLFKILLVTHFGLVFAHDPDQLGHRVLIVAASLAFLPSAAICAYQTYHSQMVSNAVASVLKSTDYANGVPYMVVYIIFWIVLGGSMMIFALTYIPFYIRHHLNSNAVRIAEIGQERKQPSILRILLGITGISVTMAVTVIIHHYNLSSRFPPQLFVLVFSLNLMLTYFVLEPEVITFIQNKFMSSSSLLRDVARRRTVRPTVENVLR